MHGWQVLSDRIPIQGLRPGKTNVSATLWQPRDRVVPHAQASTEVEIGVVEPLFLEPTLVHITPAAEVLFTLMTRHRVPLHAPSAVGGTPGSATAHGVAGSGAGSSMGAAAVAGSGGHASASGGDAQLLSPLIARQLRRIDMPSVQVRYH